jgi:hypothetical protein
MTFLDIYTVGGEKDGSPSESSGVNKWINTYKFHILIAIAFVTLFFVVLNFSLEVSDAPKEHHCEPVQQQENKKTEEQPQTSIEQPQNDTNERKTQFTNMEPFTNDLPYQLKNETLNISPDLDYNDFLQKMSLDQDVIEQHNQYVTDRNKVTSTASFAPSRSDNQDIVTTWGLARRTYIPIDPSARNVPSQDPEQGSKPVRLQWN